MFVCACACVCACLCVCVCVWVLVELLLVQRSKLCLLTHLILTAKKFFVIFKNDCRVNSHLAPHEEQSNQQRFEALIGH